MEKKVFFYFIVLSFLFSDVESDLTSAVKDRRFDIALNLIEDNQVAISESAIK